MPIFIDESGFTGNNLLDANQPYFTLSSVSISDAEAQGLVDRVRTDFRIQGDELKAGSLLKNPKGRKAVKYILDNIQGKYALSRNQKRYSLCVKFFEHVFEPVLQKNKSLFYANNFPLFITNILFGFSAGKNEIATEILVKFTKMMREMDFNALRPLFSITSSSQMDQMLIAMINFMEGYSDAIMEELEDLKTNEDGGKWTLDISINTLWGLLIHWAKSQDEMTIICDDSKPLVALTPVFDIMIGRTDRPQFYFPNIENFSPIFNLTEPVQFKDSKKSAGIQLADIVASSSVYALKNEDMDILDILHEGTIKGSMFPNLEHAKLNQKQPFQNFCVLQELAKRARNKSDPFLGMPEYYEIASALYDISPPEIK